MAEVLFITPPYNEQFLMPEIGVPQLRAFLGQHGISSHHIDLNHEFIHRFLPDRHHGWWGAREDTERLLRVKNHDINAFFQHLEEPNPVYKSFFQSYLIPRFLEDRPRIIGVSVVDTPQLYPACLLIRHLKQLDPTLVTIIGGPWATTAHEILPDFVAAMPELDGCISYAGERPLLELCQAVAEGSDYASVPNLTWRAPSGVQSNPLGEPIALSSIPTPDFTDLSLREYRASVLTVATQSGCYWGHCVFCHHNVESPWNSQASAGHVVDSLERLSDLHGIRHFFLADTCTDPRLMRDVAKLLIERRVEVRWSCMTRVEPGYDREFCRLLADSGCHTIFFGLESTSSEVLKRVRKGISVDVLDTSLTNLHEVGVWVNLFVIDIPSFPLQALQETLDWVADRKEKVLHVILQTFVLARSSKVWRNPEAIDFIIDSRAARDLEVFNLAYSYANKAETRPLKPLVDDFYRRFAVPELEKKRRTNPWVLCGLD